MEQKPTVSDDKKEARQYRMLNKAGMINESSGGFQFTRRCEGFL